MTNSGLQVKREVKQEAVKEANARRFRRAKVALKGALRIPGLGVEMVRTKNISEGGIGLNTLGNCNIDIGSNVQLHLNGVISGKESTRLDTYTMKVVHLNGCNLGLSFT